jgi:glycosyltransferase 2 family protein
MKKKHVLRIVLTLTVTGLALAYIFWKIDIGKTLHILANADPLYFALSIVIAFLTVPPMAWRWKLLLRAKGIEDNLRWLTRAYLVSYSASQMLPTSVGGDAVRIYETAKRHPGRGGPVAGSILLERALGGAATLILAALGIALAYGNYDIGIYLWVELAFVIATVLAGIVLFSKSVRPLLRRLVPILKKLWVERHVRAVYEGIHSYRHNVGLLIFVTGVTLVIQAGRVVSIWAGGEAVGVHLSIRPYFALGPLLFLVMLVPFTLNGVAVRESFFVSFLGKLGIGADEAFAAGFVFFLVTIALALPGVAIWGFEALRRAPAAAKVGREAEFPR